MYDNLTDAQKLEFAMTGSISDGTNLTEMFMDTSTGRAVAAALSAGGLQEGQEMLTGHRRDARPRREGCSPCHR